MVKVDGKFRKVKIRQLGRYGMYRGRGSIEIGEEGVKISGSHVYPVGTRWAIGIGICVASAIVTFGYIVLGIIPVYLLVEYVFLKKEEISVPWSSLKQFAAHPSRKLVGLNWDGPKWCNPVALKTDNWKDAIRALREKASHLDVTPTVPV